MIQFLTKPRCCNLGHLGQNKHTVFQGSLNQNSKEKAQIYVIHLCSNHRLSSMAHFPALYDKLPGDGDLIMTEDFRPSPHFRLPTNCSEIEKGQRPVSTADSAQGTGGCLPSGSPEL